MPFKSEAQRRFLWLKHPDIAKRWAKEYPNQKKLPYHKKDKHASAHKEIKRFRKHQQKRGL